MLSLELLRAYDRAAGRGRGLRVPRAPQDEHRETDVAVACDPGFQGEDPLLCMGAQASIVPESFSWLSRFASFAQRGEPIPPISISWVTMNQSHACGLWKVFIGPYLSFREAKPRVQENRHLNTQGSEAVLKVQLQRRAGKNHV